MEGHTYNPPCQARWLLSWVGTPRLQGSGPSFCQSFMGFFRQGIRPGICLSHRVFHGLFSGKTPLLHPKLLRALPDSPAVVAHNTPKYAFLLWRLLAHYNGVLRKSSARLVIWRTYTSFTQE